MGLDALLAEQLAHWHTAGPLGSSAHDAVHWALGPAEGQAATHAKVAVHTAFHAKVLSQAHDALTQHHLPQTSSTECKDSHLGRSTLAVHSMVLEG